MRTIAVTPAEPGWKLLHQDSDTGELFAGLSILAWHIGSPRDVDEFGYDEPNLSISPVTVDGIEDFYGYIAPSNGGVIVPGIQIFETLDAARVDAKLEWEKSKKPSP